MKTVADCIVLTDRAVQIYIPADYSSSQAIGVGDGHVDCHVLILFAWVVYLRVGSSLRPTR